MDLAVAAVIRRLVADSAEAERFFADPERWLQQADFDGRQLDDASREALTRLDPDSLQYMAQARDIEPPLAQEHPGSRSGNPWVTPLIALWGCGAFVVLWLVFGGAR